MTQSPHSEDPLEHYERLMSREQGPFSTHPVRLLDGVVMGRAESRVAPVSECETSDEGFICEVELDMGKDEEGEPQGIHCMVGTDLEQFGLIVKAAQGPTVLLEPPVLEVEPRGPGVAATFTANNGMHDETSASVGTIKISSLYAEGYMATCFDLVSGGRATFERVVGGFFDSLELGERPHEPTLFSMAYRVREGDRTVGFRYGYVVTDAKATPRFTEHAASFYLRTDEQSWQVRDFEADVVRKEDGTIERYRQQFWRDGQGPFVLSAKPAEHGRFRIKAQAGRQIDAIELTPKAPLGTELWAAAQLGRLVSHETEEHVYAWPTMNDGDPSLSYLFLTPGPQGVVLEQTRRHARFDEAPDPQDDVRDELHVDARGLVTKEVRTSSVDELLFARGEVPGPDGTKPVVAAGDHGSAPVTVADEGGHR